MSGPSVLPATALTEKQWQAQVVTEASRFGFWCYHTHDSRRSTAGLPDLLLVHPVRRLIVWAELKTDRGKLSHAQVDAIAIMRSAGADVRVWRPADADAVWAFIAGKTA